VAFGPVDLLINNALHVSVASLIASDLKEWKYTFAVNARAPFLLIQAFLPGMIARSLGRVSFVNHHPNMPEIAMHQDTFSVKGEKKILISPLSGNILSFSAS
jgi:NAD(P)-dependent dehydrogenase (short-subunit alcohol dehydrogenase family)